ncbi:MAG: glycine zipper 2TM domain-containing protein [Novosphingobium sp.]|uniref:glycine zipper 2TM domain-containing protein n=1 Tax=Novosphingobium sp. TaxID=1874826 RepID=UPI0032B76928
MPYRRNASTLAKAAAALTVLVLAAPAWAQSAPQPAGTVDAEGRVYGDMPVVHAPPPPMAAPYGQPGAVQPRYDTAAWERAREDWLAECRYNNRGRRGNTLGGALVGGVVGGLLGNAVAGRGDKTLGTVAGAVAGAAAGGALGNGADRRQERRARDYCESYLERHMGYGPAGYGYPAQGYAYAYQPMTVMVPVMTVQVQPVGAPAPQPRECKETQVIEEWVPVAAPARRYIPRRPAPDKRVKIVPDKRVRVN